jgi:UDP-N-acetylglucosamine acyltransferase
MPLIHPKAFVEDGAQLADDVTVGPFAYIGGNVVLGPGCIVHHHASIEGQTTTGANNHFFPNCVIGGIPQDLKYRGGDCKLVIGNNNRFREASTVHIGTELGGGVTRIGDHNLIMVAAHIAHDCIIGNHCILANAVLLAGHVVLEDFVTLSGGAAITHFVTVGQHAFVGGFSGVQRDAPPYMTVNGHPAAVRGVNRNGLKRRGFSDGQLEALKTAYRLLFSDTTPLSTQAPELKRLYPDNAEISRLLAFIDDSNNGKFGRYRESLRAKSTNEDEENGENNGR